MGNRYFITGVQLGILMALAINIDSKSTKKLLKEIEDKQYIGTKEEYNKLSQVKDVK